MITIEYAKKRLAEIAELTDGWEFGEGIAPSRTSLERAEQVLDFAHKVGIQEMEVFPRADGAVEVHLYNDPGTLEVTCWTDGTASTLVDRPNEKPCLAHKVEFGGGALNTILEFAVWSSTALSTHTTGLPKNYERSKNTRGWLRQLTQLTLRVGDTLKAGFSFLREGSYTT